MSNYFELTDETMGLFGVTLHRIRALRDIPEHGVKAGDLGGWVEGEHNLSGDAWVYGDAWVSGTALVHGSARVSDDALIIDQQDILIVHPIGPENATATAYRTRTGHSIHIGGWDGTVDTLMDEVTADHHRAEYQALRDMCAARAAAWDIDRNGTP